jgi:hypothetical protein
MTPEDFDLLLPSSKTSISRRLASSSLLDKEKRIRLAQLEGHLQSVRRALRMKASVYSDKKRNSRGQRSGTRSVKMLEDFTEKINLMSKHYNDARSALLRLDPGGSWSERLRELKKKDIRAPQQNKSDVEVELRAERRERRTGLRAESKRELSWIRKVSQSQKADVCEAEEEVSEDEISEGERPLPLAMFNFTDVRCRFLALRVEWAKALARAERYAEEEELVLEEMRRVRQYLTWKATWWQDPQQSGRGRAGASGPVKEGSAAYAIKQALFYEALNDKFTHQWQQILSELGLSIRLA